MIKTSYLALICAIIGSTLFYQQALGLNIFLVAGLTAILIYSNRRKIPIPWPFLIAYLATGLFTALYPEPLQIIVHLISFILLSGVYAAKESSLYISGLIGGVNLLFGALIRLAEKQKHESAIEKSKPSGTLLKGFGITLPLLLLFGWLYAQGNPEFSALLSEIDLSFISLGWLLMTATGFYLYTNLLLPYKPEEILATDLAATNQLKSPEAPFSLKIRAALKNENLWGKMALTALNLLLLFYLIMDALYLTKTEVFSAAKHSEAVHQGVYSLIVSILLAMVIIVVLFRGNLNFYNQATQLRKLSYSWLALNLLLALSTGVKNGLYVLNSGLTFKRIGVLVFLVLVAMGLLTVWSKIRYKRSFVYLLRRNSLMLFAVLCLCASLPWNRVVTAYNLKHIENPDIFYLMSLEDSNAPLLFNYSQTNSQKLPDYQNLEIINRNTLYLQRENQKGWREYNLYHLLK